MRIIQFIAGVITGIAILAVEQPALSQDNAASPQQYPAADAPKVAAAALALLKWAPILVPLEHFTFRADIIFDHVLPSGQKLQLSATENVALQRPSGLYVEWSGDLGDRQFWYDGKSATLYDPDTPFYRPRQRHQKLMEY